MKKLSQAQVAERDAHVEALSTAWDELRDAVFTFNTDMLELWEARIRPLQAAYTEALEAAEAFRADLHAEMEGYYDDRSETWQESPKGEAYAAWMSLWDEVQSDATEDIAAPEEVDIADSDEASGAYDGLPTEPEE